MRKHNEFTARPRRPQGHRGFSLIELTVAMAVFMVVGGAALMLIRKHAVLFSSTQNQTGVNLALRNAVAQMENDVVNAGSGYYPGADSPFWPVGITIAPATTPACNTTGAYTPACFDSMTVITANSTNSTFQVTPFPSQDAAGTVSLDPTVTEPIYLTYPDAPSAATLAARAATFQAGGEIMLIQGGNAPNAQMRPLALAANGVVVGTTVQLQVTGFDPNTPDPMGIYDPTLSGGGDKGTQHFDMTTAPTFGKGDFVINLVSTTYFVNANNQLMRQVGVGGVPDLIADRIVGFTVTPFVSGGAHPNTYDASPADYNSDWTKIRAVNIRIFARTPSFSDTNNTGYKNNYDSGNYQVQGVSVVINPRNLSM